MKRFLMCIPLLIFSIASFGQASSEDVAESNNPLANLTVIGLQNFYAPDLESMPDQSSNQFLIRFIKPMGKFFVRATLPVITSPGPNVKNGLGDFNLFAQYTFVTKPNLVVGGGPMVVAPTHAHDVLGDNPWQLGAAFIAFKIISPVLQFGVLSTYQHTVWADNDFESNDLLTAQPYLIVQLGKGTYLRSTAVTSFSPEKSNYNVPMGLGIGKVVKVNNTMFNMYFEPQYSVLHHSVGQPEYLLQAGLFVQLKGKK